jgi:hypothetical protein
VFWKESNYDSVACIVVRSRPLHVDVRFAGNNTRLRLMTSNIQVLIKMHIYIRIFVNNNN